MCRPRVWGIEAPGASYDADALPRKSQTPPPPKRPVQVPKVRSAPRDERRNRKILVGVGASALVIAAAVAAFLLLSGGNAQSGGTVETLREAGCTYENPASQGRAHVVALPAGHKPNSVPRSSGPHAQDTLIYGFYTETVPELNAVHNLEHGAVIIWLGPRVPQATINQVNEFYREDPNGLIVAQHPRLGDDIALVAWTRVARCPRYDEDAFDAFIDAFRGKGPESDVFDVSDLQPGRG